MSFLICAKCKETNPGTSRYCSKCGASLKDASLEKTSINSTKQIKKTGRLDQYNLARRLSPEFQEIMLLITVGAVTGLLGGIINVAAGWAPRFSILAYALLLPIYSPVAGTIPAIILYSFLRKFDKTKRLSKETRILITSAIGFLSGFLPFSYWIPF